MVEKEYSLTKYVILQELVISHSGSIERRELSSRRPGDVNVGHLQHQQEEAARLLRCSAQDCQVL